MFLPTLQGQASDEQRDKWLPLAFGNVIVGTYAQTELGHGKVYSCTKTHLCNSTQKQDSGIVIQQSGVIIME